MTAKTTKKRLAPLWVLACMVLIGICVFCYYFDASPLGAYELDTCTVGVYDYAGEAILETLSDTERDALVQRLREAELSHFVVRNFRSTKHAEVTGRQIALQLRFADGSTVDLARIGEYLVIENKGYRCDKETLAYIDSISDAVLAEYYPVSS